MKVAGTSPPDGHTLLFGLSSSFVALPEIAKDYPYDLVRDFVSIGFVCEQPMAIAVPPSLGVNTLGELIDHAKKRPGPVNVAALSRGGIPHLTSEWIKIAGAGGPINYPGTPQGLSDVIGGRVRSSWTAAGHLAGAINGGQLAHRRRFGEAPAERPETTIAETLPELSARLGWFTLMGPPGTPEPIAKGQRRSAYCAQRAGRSSASRISQLHQSDVAHGTADYIRAEQALWKPVIEQIADLQGRQ